MKWELAIFIIIAGFLGALLVFLIVINKSVLLSNFNQTQLRPMAASSDKDMLSQLKSKTTWLEQNYNLLSQQQKEQMEVIKDLKAYISTQSAKPSEQISRKSILGVANTQGSLFTTTSATYTPMGMYVNIRCSIRCYLWINFYTSSKNLGTPSSSQGYLNTYDVFLDNSDQSIFAQASYPAAGSSIPVSINVTIPVDAGIHTVDIRAKTTGGTLESDSSALQVMAIER